MKLKKLFGLLLAACFLLAPCTVARADIIIEPEDAFYLRHANECTYVERSFYAGGPDGSVTLLEEPGTGAAVGAMKNDTLVYVRFSYRLDGSDWGLVEYVSGTLPDGGPAGNLSGWAPMAELRLKYDNISFMEDHKDELRAYSGALDSLKTVERVVLWTYPGSGETAGELHQEHLDYIRLDSEYTDAQGRLWASTDTRDQPWMCLSDPQNEAIPAATANPATGAWQPEKSAGSGAPSILLVAALVLAVTGGTALLIRVLLRKG